MGFDFVALHRPFLAAALELIRQASKGAGWLVPGGAVEPGSTALHEFKSQSGPKPQVQGR